MNLSGRRRIALAGLAAVAIAVAVFGTLRFDQSGDAGRSGASTSLTSADSHAAPALAERPSERTAPAVLRFLFTGVATVAVAVLVCWTTAVIADRRARAIALTLHCRHRGPPVLFTA